MPNPNLEWQFQANTAARTVLGTHRAQFMLNQLGQSQRRNMVPKLIKRFQRVGIIDYTAHIFFA